MLSAMKHMVHPSSTPTQQGAKGAPPPSASQHSSSRSTHAAQRNSKAITGFDGSYRHQSHRSYDSPYDATVVRTGHRTTGSTTLGAFPSSSQESTPPGTASVPSLATQGTTGGYYPSQATSQGPQQAVAQGAGGAGMAHVPGSTAFARANAADQFKPHKPSNDLWGVNPEPWMDFATPESEEYAAHVARQHHLNQVYQHSGANSAASSQFDMEAILRGGRRMSSAENDDHQVGTGTESSASPLPERDWSMVGSGKKPNHEKHEHHGLKIRPRRFTLSGKKGLMGSPPTTPAATPASAPPGASPTQGLTMGTSPTTPKSILVLSHPLSPKSPGTSKSPKNSPQQADGFRAPASPTSPMAIDGSNGTSSTGGTSGTSGTGGTSGTSGTGGTNGTSGTGGTNGTSGTIGSSGHGPGRRPSMWQKLTKLGRTNSNSQA